MPPQFNSKLDSVNLIALCEAIHMKPGDQLFQDIAKHFVNDLLKLETIVIEVTPGKFLKGTLINTSHDNLGGNSIMGFVKFFVATYSCRICKTTKQFETIRRKEDYGNTIKLLEEGIEENIKGIKKYCVLNDLKFYHILENHSVDFMHDLNEGY